MQYESYFVKNRSAWEVESTLTWVSHQEWGKFPRKYSTLKFWEYKLISQRTRFKSSVNFILVHNLKMVLVEGGKGKRDMNEE